MTARPRPTKSAATEGESRGDRELVHAARAGDGIAFDALFYRYRDGIHRLAISITKDPSAAEEIVVDTFVRAHRALERLEPDDSLRPWLYRVAINLSYNRQPRKGVSFSSLDDGIIDLQAEGESPGETAERMERRHVVLECVEALGQKHRIVVVLHYLSGLNLTEIAEIVDAPVGTVKSRLHYALRKLRVQLSAHPGLDFEPATAFHAIEEQVKQR